MEAPEKIYRTTLYLDNDKGDTKWKKTPVTGAENIEYVRTDAFIEKACVKLKKLMYDNLMFQGRLHREEVIDNFVEDLKKAMEE